MCWTSLAWRGCAFRSRIVWLEHWISGLAEVQKELHRWVVADSVAQGWAIAVQRGEYWAATCVVRGLAAGEGESYSIAGAGDPSSNLLVHLPEVGRRPGLGVRFVVAVPIASGARRIEAIGTFYERDAAIAKEQVVAGTMKRWPFRADD